MTGSDQTTSLLLRDTALHRSEAVFVRVVVFQQLFHPRPGLPAAPGVFPAPLTQEREVSSKSRTRVTTSVWPRTPTSLSTLQNPYGRRWWAPGPDRGKRQSTRGPWGSTPHHRLDVGRGVGGLRLAVTESCKVRVHIGRQEGPRAGAEPGDEPLTASVPWAGPYVRRHPTQRGRP